MIRNVILHLHGEQPMKADIESLPTAADAGLLCTNLRTTEGRKPLSTEFLDSVYLIPFGVVRFIEIPRQSIDTAAPGLAPRQIPADALTAGGDTVVVTPPPPSGALPMSPADPPEPAEEDVKLEDLEPDADLLRRIREA
jgi:hypothetical protein